MTRTKDGEDDRMNFEMSLPDARIAFGRTAIYAATDDSRPVLNGVLVEAFADGRLNFTASDGFRLGVQMTNGKVTTPGSAIVPLALVNEALKAWPKRGGRVTVTTTDTNVAMSCDVDDKYRLFGAASDIEVSGYLVQGTYPKYRQLFPKGELKPSGMFALNADYIAEIAKVARLDTDCARIVRCYLTDAHEAQAFMIKGEVGDFLLMIMPMYLSGTDEQTLDQIVARLDPKPTRKRTKR